MRRYLFTFFLLIWGIGAFANGVCIDGLYYILDKKNLTAEVTYKSVNKSNGQYNKDWDITTASIPETVNYKNKVYRVTSIGADAFHSVDMTSVTIPNSVTSIGEDAFRWCRNLTSVVIPNSVTNIETSAFHSCINLTSITIPNGVTSIKWCTFESCRRLTSIIIPNSVTSIDPYAFCNCKSLTSISIPNSVTIIGDHAFHGSGLTSVIIPNRLTIIGSEAFRECKKLTSMIIPKSVKDIHILAFYECPKLTIYTSSDAVNSGNTNSCPYVKMSQETLMYYYPFSTFAKAYVENGINEWQKKGEFERIAEWQQRINEASRQQKINELLAEVQDKYCAFHAQTMKLNLTLGKYDAENEVFAITDPKYGTMYIAVPFDEAPTFKSNWNSKKITPQVQIYDDEVKFSALTFTMPNGKQYTYRNTDAVNYNLAEMTYNFEPLELDIAKTSTPQPQQGQRNITKTQVTLAKSAVDTNIPTTDASNPNTFAIIFANEDYKNVASVPFAKNDGTIFQKYCLKTLGIPASNIHYVENASFNDIRIQLAWLKDVCDAFDGNASIIVYYAGHGIPDEETKSAYLLPVDGDGRYVQSAYKIDEFYQKLGAMKAKSVTIFMDACFSGSKREEGMLASARGVALKAKSGVPQGNMVVFSAAQGDETAYPNNDEQHGIFTYYLLKKLQETKGDVTLRDLGDYITTNVRQQSIVKNGKPQTPCVTPSASLGTSWQSWKLK